jgi:hypothetical protein
MDMTKSLYVYTAVTLTTTFLFYLLQNRATEFFAEKSIWTATPTRPASSDNLKNEVYIKNVRDALYKIVDSKKGLTIDQIQKAKNSADLLAREYVKAVQSRGITFSCLESYTGTGDLDYFGKGAISGWGGNYDSNERKCWAWVNDIKIPLGKLAISQGGWVITPYYNANKIGEFPDPFAFAIHSYIGVAFVPEGTTKDGEDIIFDPWQNARPDIFDPWWFQFMWREGSDHIPPKGPSTLWM